MLVRAFILCFLGVVGLASPPGDRLEGSPSPIHIIKPPVRCPEGMKPDANGRCRKVWDRSLPAVCSSGEEPDGLCLEAPDDCIGEDCLSVKNVQKRETDPPRMEALTEKRSRKRSNPESRRERSKHAAFIMMLKKKKMQMMKPKPPPPPPPHHPPHHHPPPHHEESEEPPEEEPPAEEDTPAPERMFFADEGCVEEGNSTGGCQGDAEVVQSNDEFKEWKPEVSSESSESSDSSSSSDSAGESGSAGGSGESEDEVLQKAIKIKLMKLFRMKQRYGPALRRWLVAQLREYEDSFDY